MAAKDDLGDARLSEHGWEGFLTSMNPISSRKRCPGIQDIARDMYSSESFETLLGLRGALNELECGKMSFLKNGEKIVQTRIKSTY